MLVPVKYEISAVEPESHYTGILKIGASELAFEVTLMVPFSRISELGVTGDPFILRTLHVQISIKKDNDEIEITDLEYGMFFVMLMPLALQLWAKIKALSALRAQSGMKGYLELRGKISACVYRMEPDTIALLNQKKFDCKIQNTPDN